MTTAFDLLLRGYFPKELPPPFTSSEYAQKVTANRNQVGSSYNHQPKTSKPVTHSWMRVGKLRRSLSIPNPIFYYELASFIETNWAVIIQRFQNPILSRSLPTIGPKSGRAIVTRYIHRDLVDFSASVRARSKYILKTDISRFYPSIYTHSISWALHTKAHAKANKNSAALLGNVLDRCVRNSQDGQTIGIPIGPDTSLILAELILCDVDNNLNSKVRNLCGFRHVDDYELGFKSLAAAEEAFAYLQEALRAYELALGVEKTHILEAPFSIESDWVPFLRNFEFRSTVKGQHSDFITFFDKTFQYALGNGRDSVLNYALARFDKITCNPKNWTLLQDLLYQCLMIESATIIKVISILIKYQKDGFMIDRNKLFDVLNFLICSHSLQGHSSEVAWAIWALIVFQIQMDTEAASNISKMNDSVVALTALDAHSKGLIPNGLNTNDWQAFMTTDELYGEQWLLSYEANIKGWLPSNGAGDHVAADPNFALLKKSGVFFYDNSQRVINSSPTFASPSNQNAPLFSMP